MIDKKIAVLGANAFSGQDFVDLALEATAGKVVGVSRSPLRSDAFVAPRLRQQMPERFQYHALDMNTQAEELLALLDAERPQWIVNFAAQSEVAPSWIHPEHWFQTNCVALARLVNHLRQQDYLERYLHVSSPEIYGACRGVVREDAPLNPSTPYAASKAAADFLLETYRRQFDFPLLTVRATNVYGPRQQLFKIVPRTLLYLRSQRRIPLHGGGRAVKSYIHIRDVSRGELAILQHGELGEIYHLSPDRGVAVRDLVQQICSRCGHDFDACVEIVDERPGQDAAYVIDSSRAREKLNWLPTVSLPDGLDSVIGWVDQFWPELRAARWDYEHRP